MFAKGDILKSKDRSAKHPIVYIESVDDEYFVGVVITHSPKYEDNILMSESHFVENDENGNPYEFYFDNSRIVAHALIKLYEWNLYKAGQLSINGLSFVIEQIKDTKPMAWDVYISNNNSG